MTQLPKRSAEKATHTITLLNVQSLVLFPHIYIYIYIYIYSWSSFFNRVHQTTPDGLPDPRPSLAPRLLVFLVFSGGAAGWSDGTPRPSPPQWAEVTWDMLIYCQMFWWVSIIRSGPAWLCGVWSFLFLMLDSCLPWWWVQLAWMSLHRPRYPGQSWLLHGISTLHASRFMHAIEYGAGGSGHALKCGVGEVWPNAPLLRSCPCPSLVMDTDVLRMLREYSNILSALQFTFAYSVGICVGHLSLDSCRPPAHLCGGGRMPASLLGDVSTAYASMYQTCVAVSMWLSWGLQFR